MSINPKDYKNIVYDLGGVLLNIDYHLTAQAFKKLGIHNFEQLFSQAQQSQLFDNYEKGLISSDEFRNEINLLCGNRFLKTQIDDAWNAMLLDFPGNRIEILKKTAKTHRTFLLSNTTEIHIEAFNTYLKNELNINDFYAFFEKAYLSYEIGLRKPDKKIFEYVIEQNNLIPSETLYIDDSIQHIISAESIGIKAYWLDVKKESIVDIFI